jgi:D-methionine transport system substrate-binding protein
MKHKLFKKFIIIFSFVIAAAALLTSCDSSSTQNVANKTLKLGTIAGPETQLMEVAKKVAKQKYDLNVELVTFSDYTMPNVALNDGSIDANMFQHIPYLDASIKARGFQITPVGKTFIYPMGIFSKKIKQLDEIQPGDKIAIPNDPSNEARALLVLQSAGLIKLKSKSGITATIHDISDNPQQLKIVELDAAQLPRVLDTVTLAVINNTYAVPAGLIASKNAIFVERADSPYANVVVVRTADKNNSQIKELVAAIQSPEVATAAEKIFKGSAIPAWGTAYQP